MWIGHQLTCLRTLISHLLIVSAHILFFLQPTFREVILPKMYFGYLVGQRISRCWGEPFFLQSPWGKKKTENKSAGFPRTQCTSTSNPLRYRNGIFFENDFLNRETSDVLAQHKGFVFSSSAAPVICRGVLYPSSASLDHKSHRPVNWRECEVFLLCNVVN